MEAAVAAIEERVNKAGDVSYRVKIRRKGYPTLSKTFKHKTDARKYIRHVESEIDQGSYSHSPEMHNKTLADAIDRYILYVLPKKPKSQKKQTTQLQWWKKEIGYLILSHVTPPLIAECRDRLTNEMTPRGQNRSDATSNRYLAALSHLFTIAIKEWGWCEANPCSKILRHAEARGRVRFLNDIERTNLLTACKRSPNEYLYIVVVIALSTGARRGEIMNLTRDDVNLAHNLLIFRNTKNGDIRSVPLVGHARDLLLQLLKLPKFHTKLLFPSSLYPNQPMHIQRAWQRALTECGISDFVFHDLRHTAASYLAMNGASQLEIAEILGHKTLQMVKRYSHLSKDHLQGIVERMNKVVLA